MVVASGCSIIKHKAGLKLFSTYYYRLVHGLRRKNVAYEVHTKSGLPGISAFTQWTAGNVWKQLVSDSCASVCALRGSGVFTSQPQDLNSVRYWLTCFILTSDIPFRLITVAMTEARINHLQTELNKNLTSFINGDMSALLTDKFHRESVSDRWEVSRFTVLFINWALEAIPLCLGI